MKVGFFFTQIIAFFASLLIGVIIHFERSGEAGHFRTLVNRLVTFNLDQVSTNAYSFVPKCLTTDDLATDGGLIAYFSSVARSWCM